MSDVTQGFAPRDSQSTPITPNLSGSALDLLSEKRYFAQLKCSIEQHNPTIPEVINKIGSELSQVYSQHPYLSTAAFLALPPLLNSRTRMAICEGAEYFGGRLSFAGTETMASLTNAPYRLRVYEWNKVATLTGIARDSKTAEIYVAARDAVARVVGTESLSFGEKRVGTEATAFAVSKDGRFLTNYHVIEDYPTCKLVDKLGVEHRATVLMRDQPNDLAVLQLDNKLSYLSFKPLKLSEGLPAGFSKERKLLAFGHSNGCKNLHMSRSSDTDVDWSGTEIQKERGHSVVPLTTRPGNSGSPIIDQNTGLVVGVNRAIPTDKDFNWKLSIVVPSEKARDLLNASRH